MTCAAASAGTGSTPSAGPGIDGGKTATLEPWELDDEYFMLRIRIDGGALTTEQLRVIGQISVDFARDTADITDRQNVQLHWIRIEDVPEIWRRLEAVGLQTTEACGDCPRVILGSPVAGIAADEIIDPTPAIRDIVDRYIGDPEYSNLPRKFKTALTGHPVHDVAPEVNDIAFVGVVHPEHGPGFDLWVGGGLSTNPMLAVRLGGWVPAGGGRRGLGRRRRAVPRLRLSAAAHPGPDQVPRRRLGRGEVPRRPGDGVPQAAPDRRPRARGARPNRAITSGSTGRRTASTSSGSRRWPAGSNGSSLLRLAELAEAHGSHRIRTTPMQKLLVLDLDESQVDSLDGWRRGARPIGTSATPGVAR